MNPGMRTEGSVSQLVTQYQQRITTNRNIIAWNIHCKETKKWVWLQEAQTILP